MNEDGELSPPLLDKSRHLPDAGQNTRARLENVRRINRINLFVPDRGDCLPSGPCGNFSQIHTLSTPTDKDNLWVRTADIHGFDCPLPGSFGIGSKKYIRSTDQIDRFADPSDPAD